MQGGGQEGPTQAAQLQFLTRADLAHLTPAAVLSGAAGNPDTVLAAIYAQLPPSVLRDLYVEVYGAINRDLDRRVADGSLPSADALGGKGWPFEMVFGPDLQLYIMTEFEALRLRAAVERDLPRHLASLAMDKTAGVTAVCAVELGVYDFDAQAFSLDADTIAQGCFSITQRRSASTQSTNVAVRQLLFSLPDLPTSVPVPQQSAEAFANQLGSAALLTIDADLTVTPVDPREMGIVSRYQIRAVGPFVLRARDTGAVLYEWPAAGVDLALPVPDDWMTQRSAVTAQGALRAGPDATALVRLAADAPLTDRHWQRAQTNRSTVEAAFRRAVPLPQGGAVVDGWGPFFPALRPNPRAFDPAFDAAFKEWSRARAAALPDRMIWRETYVPNAETKDRDILFRGAQAGRDIDPQDGGPLLDPRRLIVLDETTFVQLPAFRTDYTVPITPELRQSISALPPNRALARDTVLEIGRPVARGDYVILPAKPLEMQVRVLAFGQGAAPEAPLSDAVYVIDTPSRDFDAPPSADIPPAPLAQGPLGWERLDLLRLRFAPQTVTDAVADAMMARRYHAEKEGMVPEGPQFFALFNSLPEGQAARAAFLTWQRSRIEFTKGPILIAYGRGQTLGLRADTGTLSSPFHMGDTMNWRSLGISHDCTKFTTQPAAVLERAASQTDLDAARRDIACAAYAAAMRSAAQPAAVQWRERGGYAEIEVPPCQSDVCKLPKALSRVPQWDMHQMVRLDRRISTAALLNRPLVQNIQAIGLIAEITGVDITQDLGVWPVDVGAAVAKAVLAGEDLQAAAAAVPQVRSDTPTLLYQAQLQAVRVYTGREPGQFFDLELEDDTPFALDALVAAVARLETAAEDQAKAAASPPPLQSGAPDVLGIRLGMPMAEAEALVRDHMPVGWSFTADRARQAAAAAGPPPAWSSGRLFVDEGNREYIALYHEPLAPEHGVLGVMRWAFVGPQSVLPESLGPALVRRYGPPSHSWTIDQSTSSGFIWSWSDPPDTGPCGFIREKAQSDLWRIDGEEAPWRAPLTIDQLALPDLRVTNKVDRNLNNPDFRREWLCPPILSVRTFSLRLGIPLPEDISHAITTVLYDDYRALLALRAVQAAGPPVFDPADNESTVAPPEIKF